MTPLYYRFLRRLLCFRITEQLFLWILNNSWKDLTACLNYQQSQFLLSGSHGDGQWIVPITLCCGSYNTHKSFLLQTKNDTLDVKELFSDTSGRPWIKINVDQTSFFRVKYDDDLSAMLRAAIERKSLSTSDKYGSFDFLLFLILLDSRGDFLTSVFLLSRNIGRLLCIVHGMPAVPDLFAVFDDCLSRRA